MPHRILIVDDEPHIVELVRVCLEDPGFEILEARDGETGLAMARQILPDVVLLDVMMPRMDGYAVCRALKEDPRTSAIPVVMLTAKGLEADRQRGLEAGADAYLSKPFSPTKLNAQVREHLQGRTPS